jgi:diamine N-acetyltransferase
MPAINLREITDENRDAVSSLKVGPGQDLFVASVAESLEEAAATPEAAPWYRAIYAGHEPVGFVMLSWDVTPVPGILGPWFLWRLLIDERHQRQGFGAAALTEIIEIVRTAGATELLTSYQPGAGEPWPFYERFGFEPTGEMDGTEIVLSLDLRTGGNMTDDAARQILLASARALAHVDGLGPSLQVMVESIAGGSGAASAAIVIPGRAGGLEIAATFGLDEAATAGLAGAITRPAHPIARTFTDPTPTFDVLPTVPGGPALRSHVPLTVTRGGTKTVLGVLALAHEQPVDQAMRPVILAAADLAALSIECHRSD